MSNNHPELWRPVDLGAANTPEWEASRRARALTTGFASEAAAVVGAGKFKPRNQRELYLAKRGLLQRDGYAPAIAHGHKYEPVARAFVEASLGEAFTPATHESECGRFVASPDGVSADGARLLEIKCPSSGLQGELWESVSFGVVPDYYYWQLVQQAALSDAQEVLFCVYAGSGPNQQAIIRLRAADLREAWHSKLKPAWERFFLDLQNDLPPGETQDPEFLTAAAELAELEDQFKALEKARDAAKDRLTAAAKAVGGDTIVGGGFKVSKATKEGSVDYKALLAEYAVPQEAVERHRKKGTTYYTVRAHKG